MRSMKWVLVLATTFLLAACTPPVVGNGVQGAQVHEIEHDELITQAEQAGVELEDPLHDPVAFVAEGELYLVLFGSSTCPPRPVVESVATEDDLITEVRITPEIHQNACTDDYAPHTYAMSFIHPVGEEVELGVLSNNSSTPIPVLNE